MTKDWPERERQLAEWRALPIVEAVARIYLHNNFRLGAPHFLPPKVTYAEALPEVEAADIKIADEMAKELHAACDRMTIGHQSDQAEMARFSAHFHYYSDDTIKWMFRYANFQNR